MALPAARKYRAGDAPTLGIQWPDMGIPNLRSSFWVELLNRLPEGATMACCVGGHGRTGTTLACLMVAGGLTADEAIHRVRTTY
jgi:protein-tyrosine phosphatase